MGNSRKKRVLGLFMAVILALGMVMVDLPGSAERVEAATGNDVVNTARGYVGVVPYSRGGDDTNGWDCSGFICYVFNQCGYNLYPWNHHLQDTDLGTYYSLSDKNAVSSVCQAGDILHFPESYPGAGNGHVAIYAGNGKMIHALNPTLGTCETPVNEWLGTALGGYIRIDMGDPTPVYHGETRGFVDTCTYRDSGDIYIDGWGYDKTLDTGYATMRAYVDGVLAYADGDPSPNFYASAPYNDGVEKEVGSRDHKYYRPLSVRGLPAGEHTVSVVVVDLATGAEIPCRVSDGVSLTVTIPGPTISNVQVSEQTGDSYLITCDVSDPAGISRVQFPTWTAENGQDDLPSEWQEGTIAGGAGATLTSVSFRVNASDHNGEEGLYYTDIYAYNNFGVYTDYKTVAVTLKKEIPIDEAHFPDAAFRAFLNEKYGETLDSNEILTTELFIPENNGTRNLTGIEYFTELELLQCERNSLTSLDLSKNHKLKTLYCYENQISSLVLASDELTFVNAYENNLTTIDLSKCPKLKELICNSNRRSITLDLSRNPELRMLDLLNTPIDSLNISQNTKLEELFFCDDTIIDFSRNQKLNTIYHHVDINDKTLDLSTYFAGLTASGIQNLQNGTLNGLVISDIENSGMVTFQYTGEDGTRNVHVSLYIRSYTDTSGGKVSVNSISLDRSELELTTGEVKTVNAIIYPINATNQNISWRSAKPHVAKVTGSRGSLTASVTGVAAGETTIYATTEDGKYVATLEVTVKEGGTDGAKIADKIILVRTDDGTDVSRQTISLDADDDTKNTISLKAVVTADGSTEGVNQHVAWSSSNTSVASVDTSGNVKALKSGSATISVETVSGKKTLKTVVTIKVDNLTQGLVITGEDQVAAGKSITLTAVVLPDSATNKAVTWTSDDPNKATVSASGVVTAKKNASGTVTITATAKDGSGQPATKVITITTPAEKMQILWNDELVTGKKVGIDPDMAESLTFSAVAQDKNGSADHISQDVVWTSSNQNIAVVSADGTVTAKKNGTATITATATDGSAKKGSVTLNVNRLSQVITITGKDKVGRGKTIALSALVLPDSTASKKVTWTSDSPTIATVNTSGRVTGKQPGTATIKATATDGSGVFGEYTVTVMEPVSKILLETDGEVATGTITHDISNTNTRLFSATCVGKKEGDEISSEVTWKTNNAGIATVDDQGDVFFHKPGTVTITATATDGSNVSGKVMVKAVQSDITIIGPAAVATGKTVSLTAYGPKVSWGLSEGDREYASITATGRLSVKKDAPANRSITVTAIENDPKKEPEERKRATYTLMIVSPAAALRLFTTEGTEVTGGKLYFDRDEGSVFTLDSRVYDTEGNTDKVSQKVTWTSSNSKIASVSELGTVTIHTAGTAKITAAATDGSGKKATVTLQVASLMTDLTVKAATDQVAAGKTVQLTATVRPVRTANKAVTWSVAPTYPNGFDTSSLPRNPVTISTGGKLSVNAKVPAGTTIAVTAVAKDGSSVTSAPETVTVTRAAGRVELYRAEDTALTSPLTGGKTGIDRDTLGTTTLKAYVYAEAKVGTTTENISQRVTWASSNPKIAVVDTDGNVTALKAGTAKITAVAADGSGKKATVTVNVASLVTKLAIEGADTMKSGKAASGKYVVTATPSRAADKSVTWSVSYELPAGAKELKASDIKIASNGTLSLSKNVPAGTVITVKAVAKDGSGVSATKSIEVD